MTEPDDSRVPHLLPWIYGAGGITLALGLALAGKALLTPLGPLLLAMAAPIVLLDMLLARGAVLLLRGRPTAMRIFGHTVFAGSSAVLVPGLLLIAIQVLREYEFLAINLTNSQSNHNANSSWHRTKNVSTAGLELPSPAIELPPPGIVLAGEDDALREQIRAQLQGCATVHDGWQFGATVEVHADTPFAPLPLCKHAAMSLHAEITAVAWRDGIVRKNSGTYDLTGSIWVFGLSSQAYLRRLVGNTVGKALRAEIDRGLRGTVAD